MRYLPSLGKDIEHHAPRESRLRSCSHPHPSCSQTPAGWRLTTAKACISIVSSCRMSPSLLYAYLFLEQTVQFVAAVLYTQPIRGVDHPDQSVCLLKVVPPVRPQRLLTTHIPYRILSVANSGRGGLHVLQMLSLYLEKPRQLSHFHARLSEPLTPRSRSS